MTVEELGQSVKAKYPQYQNVPDVDLANKIIEKYPVYKNKIDTGSTQNIQTAQDQQVEPGNKIGGFLSPAKGALKGLGSTIAGASSLSEKVMKTALKAALPKGAEKYFSVDDQTGVEKLKLQEKLQPKNLGEKLGFYGEQIGEFFIPGGVATKASKAVEGAKLLSKAPKAVKGVARLATASVVEGLLGTGQTAMQSGELGKEEVGAGVLSSILPGASKLLGKTLNAEKLMQKALGLNPSQIKNLSKVSTTGNAYTGINDFAIKNKLVGSRDEMLEKTKDLFENAISSKADILKGITKETPNNDKRIFEYLSKVYNEPGLEKEFSEITKLSTKKELKAVELDRIRQLADNSLPRAAYLDTTPLKTEGVQNMIDPIRRNLEVLDKTGTIKKTNTDIRVLYKLMDGLDNSSKKLLAGQMLWKGMQRATTGAGASMLIPGLQPLAIAMGLAGTITDVPEISSRLAVQLQKMPVEKARILLQNLIKGLTSQASQQLKK